ncbi:LapA family protein [Actinomadura rupiterrae]|uniref:LapA family protein n=1 Tax=Actinomadura rupiterrae TaxID=559627 RepID=UPI0020A54AD2|nr:lipopolysaccharide assembly protein LapA domain-containing protein [Actinomadura rupiterrae]MCP2343137.1 putative integral membrane protein [Actinomadura rupiterrae]
MPILRWSRTPQRPAPASNDRPRSVPVSRTSAAWAGLWAAAVVLIVFIVFLLSNTGRVQISFAGLHGDLPLAVALLIAMVTGIVVTLILGTARITQVRRLARRRRTGDQAGQQPANRPQHNGQPQQPTTKEAGPGHVDHR